MSAGWQSFPPGCVARRDVLRERAGERATEPAASPQWVPGRGLGRRHVSRAPILWGRDDDDEIRVLNRVEMSLVPNLTEVLCNLCPELLRSPHE